MPLEQRRQKSLLYALGDKLAQRAVLTQWLNEWPWQMLVKDGREMDAASFKQVRDDQAAEDDDGEFAADSTKSLKLCAQWVIKNVTDIWREPTAKESDG